MSCGEVFVELFSTFSRLLIKISMKSKATTVTAVLIVSNTFGIMKNRPVITAVDYTPTLAAVRVLGVSTVMSLSSSFSGKNCSFSWGFIAF